jgi:hypothetical protein
MLQVLLEDGKRERFSISWEAPTSAVKLLIYKRLGIHPRIQVLTVNDVQLSDGTPCPTPAFGAVPHVIEL